MLDKIRVAMVCETESEAADVRNMLTRIAAALSAVDTFHDKMSDLDEDAPDLTAQVAPLIERLTLTLMGIYPNPRQFDLDIKAIGDIAVRKLEDYRPKI
jgi:hypothetical protein